MVIMGSVRIYSNIFSQSKDDCNQKHRYFPQESTMSGFAPSLGCEAAQSFFPHFPHGLPGHPDARHFSFSSTFRASLFTDYLSGSMLQ
jgi:hypothetical protein